MFSGVARQSAARSIWRTFKMPPPLIQQNFSFLSRSSNFYKQKKLKELIKLNNKHGFPIFSMMKSVRYTQTIAKYRNKSRDFHI